MFSFGSDNGFKGVQAQLPFPSVDEETLQSADNRRSESLTTD
jgi:hypothetical protein